MTAEKNPHKVAAGKKGAEARRKKQERILQELRSEKEKLRGSSPSPERKSKPRSVAKQKEPPQSNTGVYVGAGLAITAAAGGAAAWYYYNTNEKTSPTPPPAAVPEVPQLKTSKSLFYME